MKKILVPIDGSAISIKVAEKAIDFAKHFGSEVTFFAVADAMSQADYSAFDVAATEFYVLSREQFIKESGEQTGNMLDAVIKKLDTTGVKINKVVKTGFAAQEITEFAKKENYDLIVMGSRGFSGVKRFFLGSVAQKVIIDAVCPVMVIKE